MKFKQVLAEQAGKWLIKSEQKQIDDFVFAP